MDMVEKLLDLAIEMKERGIRMTAIFQLLLDHDGSRSLEVFIISKAYCGHNGSTQSRCLLNLRLQYRSAQDVGDDLPPNL